MRPWTVFPNIKEKKVDMRNMLNVGSILYHAVLDLIRSQAKRLPESEAYLDPKERIKPKWQPLKASGKGG